MGQYYLLQTWGQGPEKMILPVTLAHGCVSSEPQDEAQQDWFQSVTEPEHLPFPHSDHPLPIETLDGMDLGIYGQS